MLVYRMELIVFSMLILYIMIKMLCKKHLFNSRREQSEPTGMLTLLTRHRSNSVPQAGCAFMCFVRVHYFPLKENCVSV